MDNFLQRIIVEPLDRFAEKLLQFLPNILTSLLIFVAGIILAMILKAVSLRFFRAIKLDRFSERSGMLELLKKGGIKEPVSLILSRFMSFLVIFSFSIVSLDTLNMPAIETILEKFILYLPNVMVSVLILFFGYLLSNFLGRAALIASVNAGLKISGLIGRSVKLVLFLLAITMALEQLGIGRETIEIAFAIVFGGVILALSLAFGLGGRDIAKEYLEKKVKGEEGKDDINHL